MEYLYQFNYLRHLIKNGCDWYFLVIQIFKNSIKKNEILHFWVTNCIKIYKLEFIAKLKIPMKNIFSSDNMYQTSKFYLV